jgi:hypothetical protein
MAEHVLRLPLSLAPLIAQARRRIRQRRLLVCVAVVVIGGGAAGASFALSSSSGAGRTVACPPAAAYAYETPQGGWLPTRRPFRVGELLRFGTLRYRVSGITALPHQCEPFSVLGWNGPPQIVAGRLDLQPVK